MLYYYFYLKFKSVLSLEVGTVVYVEDRAAKLVNEVILLIFCGIIKKDCIFKGLNTFVRNHRIIEV